MLQIKPFVILLFTYFAIYFLVMLFISSYILPVGKVEFVIHALLATCLTGVFSFRRFITNE